MAVSAATRLMPTPAARRLASITRTLESPCNALTASSRSVVDIVPSIRVCPTPSSSSCRETIFKNDVHCEKITIFEPLFRSRSLTIDKSACVFELWSLLAGTSYVELGTDSSSVMLVVL